MGLVDARTQRFRQGKNEMSLDDALHQGLIDPHSEWIGKIIFIILFIMYF